MTKDQIIRLLGLILSLVFCLSFWGCVIVYIANLLK